MAHMPSHMHILVCAIPYAYMYARSTPYEYHYMCLNLKQFQTSSNVSIIWYIILWYLAWARAQYIPVWLMGLRPNAECFKWNILYSFYFVSFNILKLNALRDVSLNYYIMTIWLFFFLIAGESSANTKFFLPLPIVEMKFICLRTWLKYGIMCGV